MKFGYKRFGKTPWGEQIIRPIFPIKLISGDRQIRYEVLVDSGVDECIFDREIAEVLGIKWEEGEKSHFHGVTGSQQVK